MSASAPRLLLAAWPCLTTALHHRSLIGTDSNHTSATPNYTPFKNPAVLPNDVWILPPTGPPRPLVSDLLNTPDGIAVSPDEKTLYIGVAPLTATDPYALAATDYIYAFDLVNTTGGHFAQNKRVFAKSDNGYFDGIAVDGQGNVFTATGYEVGIFSPAGNILGKIYLPMPSISIGQHPTNSVGFAGNRLIMLHNTGVLMWLDHAGILCWIHMMTASMCHLLSAQDILAPKELMLRMGFGWTQIQVQTLFWATAHTLDSAVMTCCSMKCTAVKPA